ncbi:MAG TPA: hypothetical protein VLK58_02050, partial [Conexibacter sp.]|nr:hypothetical protein [Conexibacter sp.]
MRTPPSAWEVDGQDVGLDAAGNAVAVWTANGPDRVTQAATRPLGGAWSAPVTLSPEGEEGGWEPELAVGADGVAVAVWSSVHHSELWTRQIVLAASREPGGQWSEPVALSDEEGIAISYQPEVVVDSEGNATAIWSEETEDAPVVRTRTRPRGGDWSAPVDLTDSFVGWEPQLAVAADGEVTAVWNLRGVPEYAGGIIQSKRRPGGGAWSAEPDDLSSGDERAVEPRVAVGGDGEAVAVWHSDTNDEPAVRAVRAARRSAGGGWAAAVDLARGDPGALLPQVAIDAEGTATAVWESRDAAGRVIRSRTSASGGPWSAPVDISDRDDSTWPGAFPQVTVDVEGDVTASWQAWYEDRFSIVEAARREAGSGWSAPVELGQSDGVIERQPVAVDPHGY